MNKFVIGCDVESGEYFLSTDNSFLRWNEFDGSVEKKLFDTREEAEKRMAEMEDCYTIGSLFVAEA